MLKHVDKIMQKVKKTMKKILIFDTTLRDGEQSPGVNLNIKEKIMIAKQLEKLKVDVIEAGFPISSKGSFKAVEEISKQVTLPIICALARSMKKDIDAAVEALKHAKNKRIHVFVATSKIHLQHKLKKSKQEILDMVSESVKYAKSFVEDIEFSPEDASRTDMGYMCDVIKAAVNAGATTINIPDTVGYAQPDEFVERIKTVKKILPENVVISVHCHDDLGLSVANSLAAIKHGATQVEGTINGIGERAGNTALEEVIMAIKTRSRYYNVDTNINTEELFRTSQLITKLTGMSVQKNKAIIGKNAFAHEAGIHQHGVISHKQTYEIMNSEDIGWHGDNIVIGKLSGKHAVESVLKQTGIQLNQDQVKQVIQKVKDLADKEKQVEKEDIIAIGIDVFNALSDEEDIIKLDELTVVTGNKVTSSAMVALNIDGKRKTGSGIGVGPVHASANAIKSVIGPKIKLKEYNLKAVTGGTDALANVSIKFEDKEKNIFISEAVDEDVIMASVKAIVKGANKALIFQKKTNGDDKK